MNHQWFEDSAKRTPFGRRKVTPRGCSADGNHHVRPFLAEAPEALGFITCECARASDLHAVLDTHLPDLVVLGLSAGAVAAGEILQALATEQFGGKVLLLGPDGSPVVVTLCEMGEELGV